MNRRTAIKAMATGVGIAVIAPEVTEAKEDEQYGPSSYLPAGAWEMQLHTRCEQCGEKQVHALYMRGQSESNAQGTGINPAIASWEVLFDSIKHKAEIYPESYNCRKCGRSLLAGISDETFNRQRAKNSGELIAERKWNSG